MYRLFKSFMVNLSKREDYQIIMTDYLNNTVSLLGYQEKDKIKDDYCKNNGLSLIRISNIRDIKNKLYFLCKL